MSKVERECRANEFDALIWSKSRAAGSQSKQANLARDLPYLHSRMQLYYHLPGDQMATTTTKSKMTGKSRFNSVPTNAPLEVGIFSTVDSARTAVQQLLNAGFTTEHITVVCSDQTKERYFKEFEHQDPAGTYTPAATIAGGTIGALLGGLTVLASAVATGSLALFAAGPITAWAGGVAGGLVGAMMTRGVEKELANFYQQSVISGQILVAAEDHSPNHVQTLAKAAEIFSQAGAQPLPMQEG